MEELKRLKELTDICGVSGNEYKVSQYLIKNLDNKKIDENINFVNRNSRNGDLEVKIEDYEENL